MKKNIRDKGIKVLVIEGTDTSEKPQKGTLQLNHKAIICTTTFSVTTTKFDCVSLKKLHSSATYIEVIKNGKCILIFVPRIYFSIGNGFAIFNYFATKELYRELITNYV